MVSGQQMFFARKRSDSVAAAEVFVCAKAQRQQKGFLLKRSGKNYSSTVVTKALLQDESTSLHSNQHT